MTAEPPIPVAQPAPDIVALGKMKFAIYRPSDLPVPPVDDPLVLMGIDWGYLRKGGSLLICGETGGGKSLLALQLAIHLVLGRDFFGIPVKRPSKVLILTATHEDGVEVLWSHLHGIMTTLNLTAEETARVESNLLFAPVDRGSKSLAWAAEAVTTKAADVLILNPLQHFCDGHPSEISAGTALVDFLDTLVKHTQAAVIAIHHVTKPNGQSSRNDNWIRAHYGGMGLGSLFDFFRSGATLRGVGDLRGRAILKLTKGAERSGLADRKAELHIAWTDEHYSEKNGRLIKHLGWQLTEPYVEGEPARDQLLDKVRALITGAGRALSQAEIITQLAALEGGNRRKESTVGNTLRTWVKDGVLASERKGKARVYSLAAAS